MTGAFVAIAAIDKAVRNVIKVESVTIINVPERPTFPTTHPNLKYIITPRIVRIEGVKTPPKVFSRFELFWIGFLIMRLFKNDCYFN